ncbi:MAG: hypothetical protein KDD40_11570, partial [Bdellovibrionales bacterium]|nr:hypothetical protein [Bdellovibrionales bacterium]
MLSSARGSTKNRLIIPQILFFSPLAFTADGSNRLSSINANSTEDHQHFNKVFGENSKSTSHYFCKPKGKKRKKEWT